MTDKDIEKMLNVYKMSLQTVFDYLVVCKQHNDVEKLKKSKNTIPI